MPPFGFSRRALNIPIMTVSFSLGGLSWAEEPGRPKGSGIAAATKVVREAIST